MNLNLFLLYGYGSISGQDKLNPAQWLPKHSMWCKLHRLELAALSRKTNFPVEPYNKSFIGQDRSRWLDSLGIRIHEVCLGCVHNGDNYLCLEIFLLSANVRSFIYSFAFFSFYGYITNSQCDQLSVGLIHVARW